jgi:hypothetical protein
MELTASLRYIWFSHDFLTLSCCDARPRAAQLILFSLGPEESPAYVRTFYC